MQRKLTVLKKKGFLHLFRFQGIFSIVFYFAFIALIGYLIVPRTALYFRNDIFNPFFGRLNKEDITMAKGEVVKLYPIGINKRAKYSSTDIKVAGVNIFGNVIAYRPGRTFINVKVDGEILRCRVRVVDISRDQLVLKTGKKFKLKIKYEWFGIHWYSSNKKVVRVSRFGTVTAVSKGSAVIYGKIRGATVSCKVKVE